MSILTLGSKKEKKENFQSKRKQKRKERKFPIKEWEKAKRKERKFPIKEWEKVKKKKKRKSLKRRNDNEINAMRRYNHNEQTYKLYE